MKVVVIGLISRVNPNGKQEFLLISSKKDFDEFTGFYYPPGGHLKKGEDEKQALIREIKEELGIEVEPIEKITESPGDVPNQMTHWWKCSIDNVSFILNKDEIADVRWFSEEEIKNSEKIWPATKNFFKDFIFNHHTI